jgi:predicted PurR-regulated permease PerM
LFKKKLKDKGEEAGAKKPSRSGIKRLSSRDLRNPLVLQKLPAYFLIICVVGTLILFFYLVWPFITPIFLAVVLSIAFYPVYLKLVALLRGWRRTASFLTCLLVVLIIVIPIIILVILLAEEAASLYTIVDQRVQSGDFDKYILFIEGVYDWLQASVEGLVDVTTDDLKAGITGMAQSLSSGLVKQTGTLIAGISSFLLATVVMLFGMFYFFKDGAKLMERASMLAPLPRAYEVQLVDKFISMVKAVVYGVFLTAVLQGFVGGLGFWIVGVSNPVLWGAAIGFFSLVPVIGTAVVWVPAVIVLLALGEYVMALVLLGWCLLIVSSVDNFVRPYLIGGKAKTYPLMMFLVILGGVMTMGLKGVIVGPLVYILLMSFLHIYEAEYRKVLND